MEGKQLMKKGACFTSGGAGAATEHVGMFACFGLRRGVRFVVQPCQHHLVYKRDWKYRGWVVQSIRTHSITGSAKGELGLYNSGMLSTGRV